MAIMTVGLNPAIDRIVECPDFHIGGHQQVRQLARLASGKAANVNRALAQLETDSIATGFVGSDELDFFHEQLMSAGPGRILCRFVEVGGQTRENITILDPKRRIDTHLRDRGFTVTAAECALLEQRIFHELKPDDVVVFSGSLCLGLPDGYFEGLLDRCIGIGARLVVDSSGEALRVAATRRLWMLKPNLEELRQLVGADVSNAATAIRDAAAPLLRTAQNVLVSRGASGAVLLTGSPGSVEAYAGRWTRPDPPVRTVSCGDHLLAGYIAEICAGREVERALAGAIAVATARAMSERLDELDRSLLREAIGSVVVERV